MREEHAYPVHPGWTTTPHPRFEEHYELIVEHVYKIEGAPPPKRFLGSRQKRICAFCGRGSPAVTLKKDSHAVPAGLGNRHIFSLEECDECNDTEAENELLKMVEPQRVFSRIRKRQGLPKLRMVGSESFIEGVADQNAITVSIKAGEANPSVSLRHTGPNSIEITHYRPPYRPISAIRSVLRSAWMVLPPEKRARHPAVLATARGEGLALPLEFFSFFLPGGTVPFVALRVYEKRTGSLPGADLIVSLMLSNTTLVWCSPRGGKHEPSLLPPIVTLSPQFAPPTGTAFRCSADDTVRAENAKLSIHFDSKHDGPAPKPAVKGAKKPRPQVPVRLEVHAAGRLSAVLQSTLIPHRFDERVSRFVVQGGELGASLTVHVEQPSGEPQATCAMDLGGGSVARAKKTLDFFDSMRQPDATLRIVMPDGKRFADLEGVAVHWPMDDYAEAIGWLARISEEFMVEIACPAKVTKEELRLIQTLALGMDGGLVAVPAGELTIKCDQGMALRLLALLKEGKDLVLHCDHPFNVCGAVVAPGPYRLILASPSTARPLDQVEREVAALDDGAQYPLEFKVGRLHYEFDKWLKAPSK